jgi:hypothetical protein
MSVVKIPLDVFMHVRKGLSGQTSSQLLSKAEYLKTTFKCFTEVVPIHGNGFRSDGNKNFQHSGSNSSHAHHRWKNGNNFGKMKKGPVRSERVKIGNTGDSSALIKREFFSLMNKLTSLNKSKLIQSLSKTMSVEHIDIYVPIIWDMMLRSVDQQPLYIEVINLIRTNESSPDPICNFEDIWKEYILNKKWLPEETLVISDEYDEFCDFMKWKKRAVATVHAFFILASESIISANVLQELSHHLIDDLNKHLSDSNVNTQVTNAVLEQIGALVEHIGISKTKNKDKKHANMIRTCLNNHVKNAQTFAPMIRFKIMDIAENMKV